MAETEFDLIVVGGGPGGYVAAIRAAQLGGKVALVEREHLGGICLNWGCVPTKALLRSAEIYHYMQHAADYGLSVEGASYDLGKVVERSRKIATRLSGGVKHLLKKNKVSVFDGHGRLDGTQGSLRKVQVSRDGKGVADLTATYVVLASGARARQLPGLESDGKLVWSYKEALVPEALPKSLLVIGSGAIGIEFASFYRTLGAEVTVVEILPRILPVEDEEISAFAHKAFEKQGMTILTGAAVKSLNKGKDSVTATIEAGGETRELTVERVISAVGIVGNVAELGLEVKVLMHTTEDAWKWPKAGALSAASFEQPAASEGPFPLMGMVTGQFPDAFEGKERPAWPVPQPQPGQFPPPPPPEEGPAADITPAPGKLLLLGCSEMFRRDFLRAGNLDLFLNSVDAITLGDDLVNVRGRKPVDRLIDTPSSGTRQMWKIVNYVLVSAVIAFVGIAVAFTRRRSRDAYTMSYLSSSEKK